MPENYKNSKKILGVRVDFLIMDKVLEKISQWLKDKREEKKYLVTPNPEIINYAQKDEKFREILNKADLAIPDGQGVLWAANKLRVKSEKLKVKGRKLQRVSGVDLMLSLCELAPKYKWRIGLIGGYHDTAKKTAAALRKKIPGINIVFAESGGEIDEYGNPISCYSGIPRINVDILFVAFGFPKQEYWIDKNKEKFPAKVFIPVGGAFDYISGKVKRAPGWLQNLGLEWFYRLIKEPWRIKRQLTGAKFFFLVLKERQRINI